MHMPLDCMTSSTLKNAPRRYKAASSSSDDPLVLLPLHMASAHGCSHVPLEAIPVQPQVFRRFFVQGVRRIRFEKEELEEGRVSL